MAEWWERDQHLDRMQRKSKPVEYYRLTDADLRIQEAEKCERLKRQREFMWGSFWGKL